MKYLIILFAGLQFVSCKKSATSNIADKNIARDSLTVAETSIVLTDTVVKTSKPFRLNNLSCYWKHTFILYGESGFDLSMQLLEDKSERILFEFEHSPNPLDYNYKEEDYFKKINKKHFIDINFDGYKDFVIYLYGSMPMTSQTDMFIYNKKTKIFETNPKENLSGRVIEERDSINRILVTSSFDTERQYKTRYHFDREGRISYTEKIYDRTLETNDSLDLLERIYEKYVNGKLVKTRTDTIRTK